MRRFFPDSIFARLFALMMGAILVSHLTTSLLLVHLLRDYLRPPATHGAVHAPPAASSSSMLPAPAPAAGAQPAPPPGRGPGPHPRWPPPPGFWIGLAMEIVTLTLAAWFGARMLARPIQRLARGAAQLGENLNMPAIAESGPAEARQAARIFNRMQERIRSNVEERARFLAAVSHDLRTPLTRMRLRVERLPRDGVQEKLHDDIAEMSGMLNAALDYLRGEAASETPQLLDVQALIESMAEDAAENGDEVTVSGAARPLATRPLALKRCLANLIENAIRYGGRARIAVVDGPDRLLIDILDDGPGIPQEKMGEVFEPFVRLESSRNKATGGVGLGLSIAREAAAQCGGALTLSNAPQGGLIARVELPRAPGA